MINKDRPVFVAPMAGITNYAFRKILHEHGADFVFTEMVSANGIVFGDKGTLRLLDQKKEETNVGIQIFGHKPEIMAKAVDYLGSKYGDLPLDINMGCPVPKVVKNGMGASLMREPAYAFKVVRAVVEAAHGPISVKMRSGWDASEKNAVDVALVCQEAGASMVTIHGRTRDQFYSGQADWGIIKKVREALSIPVVANGDIFSWQDALAIRQVTGCQGIMVARGVRGNPWLLEDIKRADAGEDPSSRDILTIFATMFRHFDLLMALRADEERALKEMRKHLVWYIKALPEARQMREKIMSLPTRESLRASLQEYRDWLLSKD